MGRRQLMLGNRGMRFWCAIFNWCLSLVGCSPQPAGATLEDSVRPLTTDEQVEFDQIREGIASDLQARYSVTDSIALLQRVVDDGSFMRTKNMQPLGILWGDLICEKTGAMWVTAEWDGQRLPAVNVPRTSVFLFPVAMLEKRRDGNETVDFAAFLENTVDAIETRKDNSEYRR